MEDKHETKERQFKDKWCSCDTFVWPKEKRIKKSFQFSAKPQCVTPLLITHSISGYKINHLKINMHALSSRCSLLIDANISDDASMLFCINVINKLHLEFWFCVFLHMHK